MGEHGKGVGGQRSELPDSLKVWWGGEEGGGGEGKEGQCSEPPDILKVWWVDGAGQGGKVNGQSRLTISRRVEGEGQGREGGPIFRAA